MDFADFLEPCYQLAWKTLAAEGEFAPFGAALLPGDEIKAFLSETGEIEGIRRELKAGLQSEKFIMTALVCDATIAVPTDTPQKIIAVYLDGPNAWSKLAIVPYQIGPDGQIASEAATIGENPEPLLK
ncbi:MAG: hypothetical protein AAFY11_14945 [Cyanobacteria bacterium J06641_5]